jgi:hypothetical protein
VEIGECGGGHDNCFGEREIVVRLTRRDGNKTRWTGDGVMND